MKLISWNVNGLRAAMTKGFVDYFDEQNADAFCLQEIKLSQGQLDFAPTGYHCYWNYARKKGYAGTAIFSKREPLSVRMGIGLDPHDDEGRAITLEYDDLYLVCVYTPNAQEGLARLDFRMQWEDHFRNYLTSLAQTKPVVICGDMNVAHAEIDLRNPKTNHGSAGFSDQERDKMTQLLCAGFVDTFRYLYPAQEDAYTWWSYRFHARTRNTGWRIDYFLVSSTLATRIGLAEIHSHVLGSDHCPVLLELKEGGHSLVGTSLARNALAVSPVD